MEPIERSETSVSNTQTPGNYPKETVLHFFSFLILILMVHENNHVALKGEAQTQLRLIKHGEAQLHLKKNVQRTRQKNSKIVTHI
jgi:hypothetical protein